MDALLRSLRLKPLAGSGWKVAIINEADRMTDQAEAMWLDGLEHLPEKTLVIFTTNNLAKLTPRLVRRCEVYQFDGSSDEFKAGMLQVVQRIYAAERDGKTLDDLPEGLGQFEQCDTNYSIGLAIQQITPYLRSGVGLPAQVQVPIVRDGLNNRKPKPESAPANTPAADAGKSTTRIFCRACHKWAPRGTLVHPHPTGGWQHVRCP